MKQKEGERGGVMRGERTVVTLGGWEAGCSALHRKAGTPALHPPAVSQCTLPCAPPSIYPVHGARATRLDDGSLAVNVTAHGDDSVVVIVLLLNRYLLRLSLAI